MVVGRLADEQRHLTKLALNVLAGDEFALAGSGAIREHGLIDRPTQDVDLFTVQSAQARFEPAIDRLDLHHATDADGKLCRPRPRR